MSLLTGKRLHSRKWSEKPISDEVIQQIEKLANKKIMNEEIMKELWIEIEDSYTNLSDERSDEMTENVVLDENEENDQVQEGNRNIWREEGEVVPGPALIEDESESNHSAESITDEVINEDIRAIADDIDQNLNNFPVMVEDVNSDTEKDLDWDAHMKENYPYDTDVLGDVDESSVTTSISPSVGKSDEGGTETFENNENEQEYHSSGRPKRKVKNDMDDTAWRNQTGTMEKMGIRS